MSHNLLLFAPRRILYVVFLCVKWGSYCRETGKSCSEKTRVSAWCNFSVLQQCLEFWKIILLSNRKGELPNWNTQMLIKCPQNITISTSQLQLKSLWLPGHCIYSAETGVCSCLMPGGQVSKAKNVLAYQDLKMALGHFIWLLAFLLALWIGVNPSLLSAHFFICTVGKTMHTLGRRKRMKWGHVLSMASRQLLEPRSGWFWSSVSLTTVGCSINCG